MYVSHHDNSGLSGRVLERSAPLLHKGMGCSPLKILKLRVP